VNRIMAALGRRFNRRIHDCRCLLVPLLGELDGRRQHFSEPMRQHGCLFMIAARHTVLVPPRISHRQGDRRARLNKDCHQIHQDRSRNPLPLQHADLLHCRRPMPPADNSDKGGPSPGKLTPATCRKRNVRTESAQGPQAVIPQPLTTRMGYRIRQRQFRNQVAPTKRYCRP